MPAPLERLARLWDREWFTPASLRDLGLVRIVVLAGNLILLPKFYPRAALLALSNIDAKLFVPLPALKVLMLPFGWGARPDAALVAAVYTLTVAAGLLAIVGWFSRAAVGLFAAGFTFIVAYSYSFGEVHHPEGIMVLFLFALAASPCGEALSVDAWLRRRRARRAGAEATAPGEYSPMARWPLRLAQWLLAIAYLSAGISKLHHGGLEWMNGTTLSYYLAYDGLAFHRPLGVWLSQLGGLVRLLSIGTILWELTFWIAVVVPRTAWFYVLVGLGLHTGIYVTQAAPFFHFMLMYMAFIEPIRATLGRWTRRAPALGLPPVDETAGAAPRFEDAHDGASAWNR